MGLFETSFFYDAINNIIIGDIYKYCKKLNNYIYQIYRTIYQLLLYEIYI